MTAEASPSAGGTRHYVGGSGASYLNRFDSAMEFNAEMALAHFGPYIQPDFNVVDFGCGNGQLLSRFVARDKVGIEVNEHGREAAATRGIRTVPSSAELPDEWADVAVSHHALEHTVSPYDQLVGLRRVIKHGGQLLLVLPIDDWRVQRRLIDEPNHHLFTWTPLLIRNLLEEAGYEVVRADVITRAAPPRYFQQLHRWLPAPLFNALSTMLAVGLRRRQLMCVARRPPIDE